MEQPNQELLQMLHDCTAQCNSCFNACLKEKDVGMMADCIRLDRECAEICGMLEQMISRQSPFVAQFAELCATVCQACGDECAQHQVEHCQDCAKVCLACAEACRNFAFAH